MSQKLDDTEQAARRKHEPHTKNKQHCRPYSKSSKMSGCTLTAEVSSSRTDGLHEELEKKKHFTKGSAAEILIKHTL